MRSLRSGARGARGERLQEIVAQVELLSRESFSKVLGCSGGSGCTAGQPSELPQAVEVEGRDVGYEVAPESCR